MDIEFKQIYPPLRDCVNRLIERKIQAGRLFIFPLSLFLFYARGMCFVDAYYAVVQTERFSLGIPPSCTKSWLGKVC